MGEITKAISDFLTINARTAFSLFAAGVALWFLRKYSIITGDATEMAVGYLTSFGLFVWIGFTARKLMRWMKVRRNQRTVAAAQRAKAEADREAAIQNLGHVNGAEVETLQWMYHKGLRRVRANGEWFEFRNLVNMKILLVEDPSQPYRDRFFLLPECVEEVLRQSLGDRDERKVGKEPPWDNRSRGRI